MIPARNSVQSDIDYDDARVAVIRAVRGAELLLADALHALRNGSPEVTDEFLDRTLRELTAARQRHDELMARVCAVAAK